MLHSYISKGLMLAIAGSLFLTACSTRDINSGRGAWNAPEYVYQPAHIKRKYAKAVRAMEAGDDGKAVELFDKFNAKYPGYPGAYVNLAIIYNRTERPEQAYAELDNAFEIIPEYYLALNQYAMMKRDEGDFRAAEDAWVRATRSEPEYLNAWYNLGVLYDIYLQDLPAAVVAYRQYQELLVDSGEGHYVLGRFIPPPVIEPDAEVDRWIVDLQRRSTDIQTAKVEE